MSETIKKEQLSGKKNQLSGKTLLVLIIIMFIIALILLSNFVMKFTRLIVDNQYGKASAAVRLSLDDEESFFKSQSLENQLKSYRAILSQAGRYTVWPRLVNFDDRWEPHKDENSLPNRSIWFVMRNYTGTNYDEANMHKVNVSLTHSEKGRRGAKFFQLSGRDRFISEASMNIETKLDQNVSPRKLLFFIHGGATFAGSPHKYNNLHWLKTLSWFGRKNDLFTDVISVDYSLQPENSMDKSITDCFEAISKCVRFYRNKVETVMLIGFSAGCLLSLQTVLLIEIALRNKAHPETSVENLFGVRLDNLWLEQLIIDWPNIKSKSLHLLSPLVRLDRLFINEGFDCSNVLQSFTKSIFEAGGSQKYDALYWLVMLRCNFPSLNYVGIFDVCRNSLSNHAITLYNVLLQLGRQDDVGPLVTELLVFDESNFFIDSQLMQKISMFEASRGLKPNKYMKDVITTNTDYNEDSPKLLNMLHYHFFPYILLCDASWITMRHILETAATLVGK